MRASCILVPSWGPGPTCLTPLRLPRPSCQVGQRGKRRCEANHCHSTQGVESAGLHNSSPFLGGGGVCPMGKKEPGDPARSRKGGRYPIGATSASCPDRCAQDIGNSSSGHHKWLPRTGGCLWSASGVFKNYQPKYIPNTTHSIVMVCKKPRGFIDTNRKKIQRMRWTKNDPSRARSCDLFGFTLTSTVNET